MKPKCDHLAPSNWEPTLTRTWQDFKGVFRRGPRCPTWMLHKGRQCAAAGTSQFPHYCTGYGHDQPLVITASNACLQCSAEGRAESQKERAKKVTAAEVRSLANGGTNGAQAEIRARMSPHDREVEQEFNEWIESDRVAKLRDLADLAEDGTNLKELIEGMAAGLALFEAGDLGGGQALLTETFQTFPGFAFTGETSEPMPPMGGYVSMAQVREIMEGLWLIAMQHLSPPDYRHFRAQWDDQFKPPSTNIPHTVH